MSIELIVALVAGFVSFISPCVLPLVPAYIGYMGGRVTDTVSAQVATGNTTQKKLSARFSTFIHGLAFVGGFTVVFVALGLIGTAFVQQFGSTNTVEGVIGRVGGVLIIFFGLHFMGILPDLFAWLRIPGSKTQPRPRVGVNAGVIAAIFAVALLALLSSLFNLPLVPLDAYLVFDGLFSGDLAGASMLVQHTISIGLVVGLGALLGGMLFRLFNQNGKPLLLGVITGLAFGSVLVAAGFIAQESYEIANIAFALGAFALWGLGVAAIYQIERQERAPFELIFAHLAFSLVFAVALTALIAWSFTGTVALWDTASYAQIPGFIALGLIALALIGMVTGGAFVEPAAFWDGMMDRVNTMLYADTRREMSASGNKGLLGSGFMGVVFAAGWSPCIGPTLGVALTLAANNPEGADLARSAGLMTAYSLGLGLPFLMTALMLDSAQGGLRRLTRHMPTIKAVSGAFLIVIGIAIASGRLQQLSAQFSNQFGDFSYRVENCTVGWVEGDIRFGQVDNCFTDDPDYFTLVALNTGEITQTELDAQQDAVDLPVADTAPETTENNISEPANTPVDPAPEANTNAPAAPVGLAVGNTAPDFTTQTVSGETVSLSDYRGDVVLLNFWFTDCAPCRFEMPEFEEAYQTYADEGFTIIAVNREEEPEAITSFADEIGGLSFPLLLDENGDLQFEYGITGYPATFVLDRNGEIIFRSSGPMTADQIEEVVTDALS